MNIYYETVVSYGTKADGEKLSNISRYYGTTFLFILYHVFIQRKKEEI